MPEHHDHRVDLDALARATDGLCPEDGLVDAVMTRVSGSAVAEPIDLGSGGLGSGALGSGRASSVELDESLARLAVATGSLEPNPALAESVMESIHALGARRAAEDVLEAASRLTTDLRPSDELSDEVMAALDAGAPRSRQGRRLSAAGIARAGRSALLVAAAVAAVCVGYASYVERQLDGDVMAAVDLLETSE